MVLHDLEAGGGAPERRPAPGAAPAPRLGNGHRETCGPADRVPHLAVCLAIADLALPQREAVVLHYILGFPLRDLSRMCGVPVNTVKSRIRLARAKLAARWTE